MQSNTPGLKEQFQLLKAECFKTRPSKESSLKRIHFFTSRVDTFIQKIYTTMIDSAGVDKNTCLIALGGYGRQELCPYSDIDLLILHNPVKNKIESMVRLLWDLGINLGCVVRTIPECSRILGEEIETDTAFLQMRYIAGNHGLYIKLYNTVIHPYFKQRKMKYINELRQTLFARVFNPTNTIFHIEPDLKNGICGLRDCHRILWSEQIRTEAGTFKELHTLSNFNKADVKKFSQSYEFLLSLRVEMHLFHNRRIDVLESSFQEVIARSMGFSDTGLLLETYFKNMKHIKSFVAAFMEKSKKGEGFFNNWWRKIASVKIDHKIYFIDGIFYPIKGAIKPETLLPRNMLYYFQLSLRYEAFLSHDFCNLIRNATEKIPFEDFISKQIYTVFRKILNHNNPGQTLVQMLETGIIEKIIPEFRHLICKVEYDTYHEYTVDQHTLLMVAGLDMLNELQDQELYRIYCGIKNKFLLRFCLLLHDIGKSIPGDHCKNGAIIASHIGSRLGLCNQEIDLVQFIIYNHLLLSEFCFTHDLEEINIKNITAHIKNKENLDILYILTVLDIKNVGSKTWTEWKGVQLRELYSKIVTNFINESGKNKNTHIDASGSYYYSFFDSGKDNFQQWLKAFREIEDKSILHLHGDEFTGFIRLTVIGLDRRNFFTDIVGCISSEGYNILSAKIFSTEDSLVLDIFYLEPDISTHLTTETRIDNIHRKWKMIQTGNIESSRLIKDRLQNYPVRVSDRTKNEKSFILVNNQKSEKYTVLEVKTKDRFGLLFKISQILSKLKINIESAKLSTRIDRIVDVFYLTNKFGNKITDEKDLSTLEKTLNTVFSSLP